MAARPSAEPFPWLAGTILNLVLLVVLAVGAWLKEDPLFWRNTGGSPIGLRELVGSAFYPLLFLESGLLILFSWAAVRCVSLRCPHQGPAVTGTALFWGLWLVVILILVANNLENLFSGRPLHWHPL